MASPSNRDLFTCPICLDLLKNPVTILCGHNYCKGCIEDCWAKEEGQKGICSCPQCRQTFTQRPVLNQNNIVAELVEQFKKANDQATCPVLCSAGPGDVECDVCTGKKPKATKSCLDCLLSYCETHFLLHNDVNPGRRHRVVNAISQLKERICAEHRRPLEIFCRKDQRCVCLLCLVHEHKGHDTVSAEMGRLEKQARTGFFTLQKHKDLQFLH